MKLNIKTIVLITEEKSVVKLRKFKSKFVVTVLSLDAT